MAPSPCLRKQVDEWEAEIFTDVLKPSKTTVIPTFNENSNSESYEHCNAGGTISQCGCLAASAAINKLATAAKSGDMEAVGYLAHLAARLIYVLNELADTSPKAEKRLSKIAQGSERFPQFVGKHSDVLAESQDRMRRLKLGTKSDLKAGKWSNREASGQLWRAVIGGYIERTKDAVERARRTPTMLWDSYDLSYEGFPQWVRDAQKLSPDPGTWANFALRILKTMNGGRYPADFIRRGASNGESYLRDNVITKSVNGAKNQAIIAAEKAWRKYWEARF